ncbi:putative charged multivesicular body protein 7 [Apostichopus japonicus]|uniref:Putative charged multivesicular body protein 7 n=1 Tax=Stichopus japonicus TaxID=307972 RepID=A0A2G8L8I7_STIJA|nr:putative charged multivesicular body protein 7 [Apostichopus japonicus]
MEREYLPPCWVDEDRINYLFSAFRKDRASNQQDWDTKLTFWVNCIEQYCKHCKTVVIDSSQISRQFERNGVVPMGMDTVLKEMYCSKKLVLQSDFVNSIEGSWLGWSANMFIGKPARWAYNSLVTGSEKIPSGSYIHQGVLEDMADKVLSRFCSPSSPSDCSINRVIEQNDFESSILDICGDDTTRHLVLLKLRKMKKVEVATLEDGCKVVKYASSKTATVIPLSETEIGIFRLQKTIAALEEQLTKLSTEITDHQQQARLHIRKGLKTSAKNSLRKKKLSEQKLEGTERTLNTLQNLLEKIQAANTDRMIIEAYKAGSSALRGSLKENNLTPETVGDALSEVQEVMEMCNEINDTIVQGNKGLDDTMNLDLDIDETTLEAELNALVNLPAVPDVVKQEREETDDLLVDLPAVPTAKPEMSPEPQKKMVTS